MAKSNKVRKKIKASPEGRAYITSSFNNIIISITDTIGNVIAWSSAGKSGFRGSKKNTPYAAQVSAQSCGKEAYDAGMRRIEVFVKGTGAGRESAIRALGATQLQITRIQDNTPIPHNGCRPPKKRRV
jgi:small subunit ribosomal protein S11